MKKLVISIFLFSCFYGQTFKIGSNTAELSNVTVESFESGIVYGIGTELNIFNSLIDFEIIYTSNNYFNSNESEHVYLQFPISKRFHLSERLYLRAGIQYDHPLSGKVSNHFTNETRDLSNELTSGFSYIAGFGLEMTFTGTNKIFIEARYILPQYNYLEKDNNNIFGTLKQFQISAALKL